MTDANLVSPPTCSRFQVFFLTSAWFGAGPEGRLLHFDHLVRGSNVSSLELQGWANGRWAPQWSWAGDGSPQWRVAEVALPPEVAALRFVAGTGDASSGAALRAIGIGPAPAGNISHEVVSCGFEADACFWIASQAGRSSSLLDKKLQAPWVPCPANMLFGPLGLLAAMPAFRRGSDTRALHRPLAPGLQGPLKALGTCTWTPAARTTRIRPPGRSSFDLLIGTLPSPLSRPPVQNPEARRSSA